MRRIETLDDVAEGLAALGRIDPRLLPVIARAGRAQPALSAPLRALATLVGYSRVHTGVHYPADVVAGAFIGVTAAEAASRLLERR